MEFDLRTSLFLREILLLVTVSSVLVHVFFNSVFVPCYSFVDRIIFVLNFFVFVCCSEATTTMAEPSQPITTQVETSCPTPSDWTSNRQKKRSLLRKDTSRIQELHREQRIVDHSGSPKYFNIKTHFPADNGCKNP